MSELKRCAARLNEIKTGEYDMKALVKLAEANVRRLDVADYVSPCIQVIDIPNMGKGYVALDDIKRGTLLLANKAACITYQDEAMAFHLYCLNYYSKRYESIVNLQCLASVYFKLQHDPFFAKEVK